MRNKLKNLIFTTCALFCLQTSPAFADLPACPAVEDIRDVHFHYAEYNSGYDRWVLVETASYNSARWNIFYVTNIKADSSDDALIKGQAEYLRLASQMVDNHDCVYLSDGEQMVMADRGFNQEIH